MKWLFFGNEVAGELAKKSAQEERIEIPLQNGLSEYTEIINK